MHSSLLPFVFLLHKLFHSLSANQCLKKNGVVKNSLFLSILQQVKNFISLAGPHAGTASIPYCEVSAPLPYTLHI